MAIATLEDLDGSVEVLVFPDAYARCSTHLRADAAVFVCGTVNLREDKPKVFADQVILLDDVPKRFTKAVHIRFPAESTEESVLNRVQEVLQEHKGTVPVMFCFMYGDGKLVFMEAHNSFSVTPSEALVQGIEAVLGEDTVWLKVDTEKLNGAANGNGSRRERRFPRD